MIKPINVWYRSVFTEKRKWLPGKKLPLGSDPGGEERRLWFHQSLLKEIRLLDSHALLQDLPVGFQIRHQNGHAVDVLIGKGPGGGNSAADDFQTREHGKQLHGVAEDLHIAHVCGDHGENLGGHGEHLRQARAPVGIQNGAEDLPLPVGPAEVSVGIQLSDAGVGQSLIAAEDPGAGGIFAAGLIVDEFCLVCRILI